MAIFRRTPKIVAVLPESDAGDLLGQAVGLLEEAFGGRGNWSAPTSWVERRAIFLDHYEEAMQRAKEA